MNCSQFEQIVFELARQHGSVRGSLMEAGLKADGLRHAEACADCAARLAGERSLTAELRALALATETSETPARVEAALLTAFRERQAHPLPLAAVESPRVGARVYWLRWAVAAAAVLLVAAWLAAPQRRRDPGRRQDGVARHELPSPPPNTQPERVSPAVEPQPTEPPKSERVVASAKSRHLKAKSPWDEAQLTVELGPVVVTPDEPEVATDFIPVSYGAAQLPVESGQVMRVKMPRSALSTFGLPVNYERGNEPVKADVLMGADGMARAIRFVR